MLVQPETGAYARLRELVDEVDGLRIVALDTTVPGYHDGELRAG